MKYAEELLQVWGLIEIVFKLVIEHSNKKGVKVPVNPFADPFKTEESLYVSDQEFIEKSIDLAFKFCNSEGVIEEHKKFLNESNKKTIIVNGHTQFLIALIKIVLKNLAEEDLEQMLIKISKITQYIAQLAEYVKDRDIETENLLLLLSILIQEHNKAQKNDYKATLLRNTIRFIITHITTENKYILIKDYIKKALNMNALKTFCDEKVICEKNLRVARELDKVSDKAFSELQVELRRMVESFIRRKQEIKVKAARNRFNLSPYLSYSH
jgi:hypothetical protein